MCKGDGMVLLRSGYKDWVSILHAPASSLSCSQRKPGSMLWAALWRLPHGKEPRAASILQPTRNWILPTATHLSWEGNSPPAQLRMSVKSPLTLGRSGERPRHRSQMSGTTTPTPQKPWDDSSCPVMLPGLGSSVVYQEVTITWRLRISSPKIKQLMFLLSGPLRRPEIDIRAVHQIVPLSKFRPMVRWHFPAPCVCWGHVDRSGQWALTEKKVLERIVVSVNPSRAAVSKPGATRHLWLLQPSKMENSIPRLYKPRFLVLRGCTWPVATLWGSTERGHFHHPGSSIGQCGQEPAELQMVTALQGWSHSEQSPNLTCEDTPDEWEISICRFEAMGIWGVSCYCSIVCSILFTHRFQQISLLASVLKWL